MSETLIFAPDVQCRNLEVLGDANLKGTPSGNFAGAGGGLSSVTVDIPVLALTSLNSSPIASGIPVPGAGKKLVLLDIFAQYAGGTSEFQTSVGIKIVYDGDTLALAQANIIRSLLAQNTNVPASGSANPGFDPTNKSLTITSPGDAGVFGAISSIAVTSGQGGTGYANGDLFNINGGNGGIGIVVSNTGGVVDTVAVTGPGTSPGNSYQTDSGLSTTVNTGGGDGTLQVDLTVPTPGTGNASVTLFYQTVDALV